jgi:PII-like signaling protein
MNTREVAVVRIYLTEGEGQVGALLRCLHDDYDLSGVTVFRGITGFGRSGAIHSASLVDLSLDLPVVVEFFDDPERVDDVLAGLAGRVAPGHLVTWRARVNV